MDEILQGLIFFNSSVVGWSQESRRKVRRVVRQAGVLTSGASGIINDVKILYSKQSTASLWFSICGRTCHSTWFRILSPDRMSFGKYPTMCAKKNRKKTSKFDTEFDSIEKVLVRFLKKLQHLVRINPGCFSQKMGIIGQVDRKIF